MRFTLDLPAGLRMATGVMGTTLALSPDGSQLVYLTMGPEGTELFLKPRNRAAGSPIQHTRGASQPFFSPDGEWLGFVVGNTIRKVPLRGGPAITVAEVATNVPGASWGHDSVIVFATQAGLWRVATSGRGVPQVVALADTGRGERYRWPEALPGGRAAVFARIDESGFHLAAVSVETGVVVPLGIEGTDPRFVEPGYLLFAQPDGSWLAAPFDANAVRITGAAHPITDGVESVSGALKLGASISGAIAYAPQPARTRTLVFVSRATGRGETLPLPPRGFSGARFSPDGRRIATSVISGDRDLGDIWLFDLATGSSWRVTFDSGSVGPVWTDDRHIAFGNKPGGRPAGWAIRRLSADRSDSAETLLPFAPGKPQLPTDFAREGRALVLNRIDPVMKSDIWILPLEGDQRLVPYLRGPFEEHSAVVSPNGRWLAYVSNETGQNEVYVRPFPMPATVVPISLGGGREPRWAPDGRELFYRGDEGMVAVAVTSDPISMRVVGRTVLFDDAPYLTHAIGAAYDVHPDGRRFLMIRRGSETPQAVVVLHLFDQLGTSRARRSMPVE
jgi:serine/threonine-protein kinase